MENDIYEAIQSKLSVEQNKEGMQMNGEEDEADGFRRLCR